MSSKTILTMVLLSTLAVLPVFAQENTYIDMSLDSLDNKSEMMVYVNIKATEYGVSPKLMKCIVNHENKSWQPDLQSLVVVNGVREDSWGLSQIHLPSNTSVSKDEAVDPKYAIDFMAREISLGHAWKWSTLKYCRQYL